MALPAGSRVGPYEIQSPLGAGGMGQVYRARDPRLGREVAIKMLPAEWAADAERLQRFEQEARAAAALNHPNILAVHDIGRHEGVPYIVSELLDGDTLDSRSLLLRVVNESTQGDFVTLRTADDSMPVPYLAVPFNQTTGELSRDGRWVAYTSNDSGRTEIYVQSFPSPATKYTISTGGGSQPRWRGDGREMFYLTEAATFSTGGPNTVMSVAVETVNTGLKFGIPTPLFDAYAFTTGHAVPTYRYSVTSDGQRFLVARQLGVGDDNPGEAPLTVILNWNEELKQRVPTR